MAKYGEVMDDIAQYDGDYTWDTVPCPLCLAKDVLVAELKAKLAKVESIIGSIEG